MLKILNKGSNSTKSNNKNILTGKEKTLGKNNPKNIKKQSTKKKVPVNLSQKKVNMCLKKRKMKWKNQKQKKNNQYKKEQILLIT